MQKMIGIRDAKAQLSRLIKEVQRGAEWIITDHGTPVAKITPIPRDERSLSERLRALEERGWIEPVRQNVRNLPPPLPLPEELAQRWLDEDRNR